MRSYQVRTYGCQMNVHDSERLSGLLEDAGYTAAPSDEQADVVVFNTCAVRENADNKLYGNLSHLAPAHGQVDVLEHVQVAVPLVDVVEHDQRVAGRTAGAGVGFLLQRRHARGP